MKDTKDKNLKIVLQKEQTFEVDGRKFKKKRKEYFVRDTSKDFSTQKGIVSAEQLNKKNGSRIKSSWGKELIILTPTFIDLYKHIKRAAQIIPLKDIGTIITTAGIGKESRIVDAGAGSGGLSCFLAHIAKEVTTYDIRKEHISIVENNQKFLNLKNLHIKNKNIYDGIDEKNIDAVTLDIPEPWKALPSAIKALKIGGFVISYSPTIPQTADLVEHANKNDNLLHIKTVEIIERSWEFDGRKIRPKTDGIGHSGFVTFLRRI